MEQEIIANREQLLRLGICPSLELVSPEDPEFF
jgi:hypothetical protein